MPVVNCPLCEGPGGVVLLEFERYRIIRVEDTDYPGYCRVVWRDHVAEMSDLSSADQHLVMNAVMAVERALRGVFAPDKMNLASFGNVVAHLHWHVIARKFGDRHFPQPVWGAVQREAGCQWPELSDEVLRGAIAEQLAGVG